MSKKILNITSKINRDDLVKNFDSFLMSKNLDHNKLIEYENIISTIDFFYQKLKMFDNSSTTITLKKVFHIEELEIIINLDNREENIFSKIKNIFSKK